MPSSCSHLLKKKKQEGKEWDCERRLGKSLGRKGLGKKRSEGTVEGVRKADTPNNKGRKGQSGTGGLGAVNGNWEGRNCEEGREGMVKGRREEENQQAGKGRGL